MGAMEENEFKAFSCMNTALMYMAMKAMFENRLTNNCDCERAKREGRGVSIQIVATHKAAKAAACLRAA
jgi:hypothetical protein